MDAVLGSKSINVTDDLLAPYPHLAWRDCSYMVARAFGEEGASVIARTWP
jgi:hypothetical protein